MRRLVPLAAVVLLAPLVATGCGASHAARPTLSISAHTALIDAPPRIVVQGVAAHTRVVVRAATQDLSGQPYRGRVVVRTSETGVARVPTGTLLSSMHPRGNAVGYGLVVPWVGAFVTVSAVGSSVRFRLLVRAQNVAERELRPATDGFYGDFFHAPFAGRHTAVLLFGGAEGGLAVAEEGALLASRGFPTLALAYFEEPGLPATLRDVPLEYFARALRWLATRSGVEAHRLVVDGYSRGSEAALLTGAYFPRLVHAVVAVVPGNVVLCAYPGCGGPAWTLHGRALPYQDSFGPVGEHPIPAERFPRRVLLVCGGGDLLWPSCPMAEAVAKRRHGLRTQVVEYPDAGHGIANLTPNVPMHDPQLEGFEPTANARARVDAWPKLLAFLRSP